MGETLSARVVACRLWRWMPGMLAFGEILEPEITSRFRVDGVDSGKGFTRMPVVGEPVTMTRRGKRTCEWAHIKRPLPDLPDPATAGCIWALVRSALPDGWGILQDEVDVEILIPRGALLPRQPHIASAATTEGERAAECLLWLAAQETPNA